MKNFKRIISLIIINCFLLSFVYGELAAAIISDAKSDNNYEQIFKDFVLPYSYGQITSSHFASTDRVIINIQDLHCHPNVQKNISNIIGLFDKQYGVKKIYLEGAYGEVDTQWLKQTTETTVNNQLIDKMIDSGRLTGAEYYSLTNGRPNIIEGLESKQEYFENLQRFGDILESKQKIELILKALKESTQNLKTKYYERRQLKLEDLSNEYRSGKIGADKYFKLLAKHIDKLGIDLTKYENTINYIQLLIEQKTLNFEQTTKELQALVMILKQKLPYSTYKILLDSTENFSKMDRLYGYLVNISRQYDLNLKANFPELDRYFQYIELSQKINPLELITEEARLINEINTKFSTTRAQREVVFLVNFEKYLENYLTSKITAEDYEYYLKNMSIYKKLWNKYVDTRVLSLLDKYLAEADKFYKVNTDRNKYFADNILKGIETSVIEPKADEANEIRKIMNNMDKVKRLDIIVTGGFHTDSVSKILKDNNVSYIVITPNVTGGIKLAEETYYKIAKEQSKISFQALALMSLSLQVMLLKEQGIPLETIKKTLITDTNNDLLPLIESAFNGKIKIQDTETLVKNLNELTKETKFASMLNFDEQGDIKEAIAKLLGTDVAVLEYINIDKLVKSWKNNDFKTLKKLTEDAKLRQDLSVNGTYIEKTLTELIIIFKNISKLTDENVVNCAVEAVYSVLDPVTRPQKTILALQMKVIEIAEKIYNSKGYTSLYAMWQMLKNDGYNAYEADSDILNKALNTAKPVILAVSSNGMVGELNHYITVTLLKDTNSVVIKDSNSNTRIIAIDDLFVLLEQNYGWQNNNNFLLSYKLEGQAPVSSEQMKQIYGAEINKSDKPDITFEQQLEAISDYTATNGYVNVYLEDMLTDEKLFLNTVKNAVEANKLIAIRILREDYNSDLLTEEELLKKYKAIKKIIKNFSNLEKIFPNIKKIFEMPTAYSANFFLSEMLKNAFVHGNQGNNDPIIMHLKFNENDDIKTVSVYNLQKDSEMNDVRKKLATKAGLTGYHIGTSIMLLNYFRTFKSGVRKLNGIKFYVATSELRRQSPNILKNQSIAINNFFEKHTTLDKTVKTTMEIISTILKLAGIIWVPLTLMSLFGSQAGVILTLVLTGALGAGLILIQDIISKKSGQTIKPQTFRQRMSAWLQITQVSSVIVVEWQVQFIYNIFLRIIEKIQYVLSAEDELFEEQINFDGSTSLKIKNTSENFLTGFLFKTLNMTAGYQWKKQTIWQKTVTWVAEYIIPLLFAEWVTDINNLSTPSVKNIKLNSSTQENIKTETQKIEKTKDLLIEFRNQFKHNIDYIDHFLKVAEERQLTDSEKKLLASNMNALSTAVEVLLMESIYIDSYTKGHAEHVATVSLLISRNIKNNLKEKYEPYFESYIKMVALLHDIGKNGIPNNILNKPGQLSDSEYELMQKHASVGADILNETGFGFLAVDVKNHHEKYDGTGYTQGLSGDQISLVSSIVALADSYDSMSRDRVYRQALPKKEVIKNIRDNKGKQFNPFVTDAFVRTINTLTQMRNKEELDLKNKIWIAQIIQTEILKGQMSSDELSDLVVAMTKNLTFKDKDTICDMLIIKNEDDKKQRRYQKFKIGSETYIVHGVFDNTLKYGQYNLDVLMNAIYGGLTTSEKDARIDIDKNTVTREWLEKVTKSWTEKTKKRFVKTLKIKNVDPAIYQFLEYETKQEDKEELTLSEILDIYAVFGEIKTDDNNAELVSKIANFNLEQQKFITKKITDRLSALSTENQRHQIYGLIGFLIFGADRYLNTDNITEEEFENIIKTFNANHLNNRITLETVQNINIGTEYNLIKEIIIYAFQLKNFPMGLYTQQQKKDRTETVKKMVRIIMSNQNNIYGAKTALCIVSSANENLSALYSVVLGYILKSKNVNTDNVTLTSAGIFAQVNKKTVLEEYGKVLAEKGFISEYMSQDEVVADVKESKLLANTNYSKFDYFLVAGEEHRQNLINTYNIAEEKIILLSELSPELIKGQFSSPIENKISKRKLINFLQNLFETAFIRENLETKVAKQYDKIIITQPPLLKFIINLFSIFTRTVKMSSIVKSSIKIVSYTRFAKKSSKTKEGFDIDSNLLIVDNAKQADELRTQGFNTIQIEYAKDLKAEGEQIGPIMENIYNGATVRAVWDEKSKKLYIYSNSENGLEKLTMREVKEAIQELYQDGKEIKLFYGIERIILPDNTNINAVLNKMINKEKDSITRPGKEINLDIRKNRANFSVLCQNNFKNGIRIMTISSKQAKSNKRIIKQYQQSGMSFMLAVTDDETVEYIIQERERDGLNGMILDFKNMGKSEQQKILEKVQDLLSVNMLNKKLKGTIQVYVEGISNELLMQDIYQRYGVIPILNNIQDAMSYSADSDRKYIINLSEDINSNDLERILNNDNIYAIIADEKAIDKIRNRNVIIDTITEVFKTKTPKQLFISEQWKIRNSKQKFEISDIKNGLKSNTVLSRFLIEIDSLFDDEIKAEEYIELLLESDYLKDFTRARVEHLLAEGRFAEAMGCIKGAVMNSVEENIITKEMKTDEYNNYMAGQFRDVRTIISIKLMMSGKSLEELKNIDGFIDSNMTAVEYLDGVVLKQINEYIREIVKEGYAIKPLTDNKEIERTADMYNKFDILVQDLFKQEGLVEGIKVSTFAIKSILSAA